MMYIAKLSLVGAALPMLAVAHEVKLSENKRKHWLDEMSPWVDKCSQIEAAINEGYEGCRTFDIDYHHGDEGKQVFDIYLACRVVTRRYNRLSRNNNALGENQCKNDEEREFQIYNGSSRKPGNLQTSCQWLQEKKNTADVEFTGEYIPGTRMFDCTKNRQPKNTESCDFDAVDFCHSLRIAREHNLGGPRGGEDAEQ